MRKILERVAAWWRLSVANRKMAEKTIGGFKFEFRKYDLRIRTLSGNWRLRLLCTEHPFGYLAQSMKAGIDDNLHGYATLMYVCSTQLTKDAKLVRNVEFAVRKYSERIEREAKARGGKVDREKDLEEMSEVLAAEMKS